MDKWDYFIGHFVSHRLDPESHEAWELRQGDETEPPTYQELVEFLSSRIRALENVDARSTTAKSRSVPSTFAPSSRQSASARALVTTPQPCSCCKGSHYVASCPSYIGKSPDQRKIFDTDKGLCFNCLGAYRRNACRSTKRCLECHSAHHTSLHRGLSQDSNSVPRPPSGPHIEDRSDSSTATTSAPTSPSTSALGSSTARTALHASTSPMEISTSCSILATAVVDAVSQHGLAVQARALLDQGSELSFVCEALVQNLHLPRRKTAICLLGIGERIGTETRNHQGISSTSH